MAPFFLINWTFDIDHCSLSPHVIQHSHNKCFVSQNRKCTICQYICLAKMEIHCLILYRNVNFTVLFCMYFQRFPIFWFLKCVKGIFSNNWIYLSGFYVYILVCFKTFETFIFSISNYICLVARWCLKW